MKKAERWLEGSIKEKKPSGVIEGDDGKSYRITIAEYSQIIKYFGEIFSWATDRVKFVPKRNLYRGSRWAEKVIPLTF